MAKANPGNVDINQLSSQFLFSFHCLAPGFARLFWLSNMASPSAEGRTGDMHSSFLEFLGVG
jgi:hypothetical protein